MYSKVSKRGLGICRGGGAGRKSGAWWWNEEVKEKVKEKKIAYADLSNCTLEEEKEVKEAVYKAAKKLAKKVVTIAKNKAFERLYQKLETRKGKKDVFKLARAREKKTRDLGNVKCIKGEYGKVLVEDTRIGEIWRSYFSMLFNGESAYSLRLARGVQ